MIRNVQKALFLVAGCGLSVAHAQIPQRLTASYDDWTVSCMTTPTSAGHGSCEMVGTLTLSGQPNPAGQITISRPSKNEPFKIFIQVPPNAWLQTGINLVSDEKQPGLLAVFRWCLPSRCLADADLDDSAVKRIRLLTAPGRADFKDAERHDVSLHVSFKGFGPALDWMEKQ